MIENACWPSVTTMDMDPPVDKTAFARTVVFECHAVDSAAEAPIAIADVNSKKPRCDPVNVQIVDTILARLFGATLVKTAPSIDTACVKVPPCMPALTTIARDRTLA
jgi:hypothetical protein